jgi:hypothetical protein
VKYRGLPRGLPREAYDAVAEVQAMYEEAGYLIRTGKYGTLGPYGHENPQFRVTEKGRAFFQAEKEKEEAGQ